MLTELDGRSLVEVGRERSRALQNYEGVARQNEESAGTDTIEYIMHIITSNVNTKQ